MITVINALIRAKGSLDNVSPKFERVRPDLDIAVYELTCDIPLEECEAEIITTIDKLDMTSSPRVEYVIFIETTGGLPIHFSRALVASISQAEASLEHYHHSE